MYLAKTPAILKTLFPRQVWNIPTTGKRLFLTFDDGPTQGITDWTLDQLKSFGAKASFFLVGNNANKNPQLVERMLAEGHAIGNHTANHINGWNTANIRYYRDIVDCEKSLSSFHQKVNLFRPPYGRITRSQTLRLAQRFKIIMWDVLSGDFDRNISGEQCLQNVLQHTAPGSIIVFHDSKKAAERMQYALPKVLEHFTNEGFTFESLALELPAA